MAKHAIILTEAEVIRTRSAEFSALCESFGPKAFVVVTPDMRPSDASVVYGTGRLIRATVSNYFGMFDDTESVFEDLRIELSREELAVMFA